MSAALEPGQVFARDFRIERKLSQGGMGAVYVARQLSTDKLRALKLMHPQLVPDEKSRQRFVAEARVGARIASDHVVEVLSAGVDEESGVPWLAMELLDGVDLATLCEQRGALPVGEVRALFLELSHALSAAHAQGIVHRDLKPENLFLARSRRQGEQSVLKVLDFGIATALPSGAGAVVTTAVGSPLWMAPEQARPGDTITPATDVWALGLIAFRLLTGKSYWRTAQVEDASIGAVLTEILVEPLVPASARATELASRALPPGFDAWFARCVDRDAKARPADAQQALSALDALLAPLAEPVSPAPPAPPSPPPGRGEAPAAEAFAATAASATPHAPVAAKKPFAETAPSAAAKPFADTAASASAQRATPHVAAAPSSSEAPRVPHDGGARPAMGLRAGVIGLGVVAVLLVGAWLGRASSAPPTPLVVATPPLGTPLPGLLSGTPTVAAAPLPGALSGTPTAAMNPSVAAVTPPPANPSDPSTMAPTAPMNPGVAAVTPPPATPTDPSTVAPTAAMNPGVAAVTPPPASPSVTPPPGVPSATPRPRAPPKPAVVAAPQTGTLSLVTSEPCVAKVDGDAVGQTPLYLPLTPGPHKVVLRLEARRYETELKPTIVAGEITQLTIQVPPELWAAEGHLEHQNYRFTGTSREDVRLKCLSWMQAHFHGKPTVHVLTANGFELPRETNPLEEKMACRFVAKAASMEKQH